MGLTLSLLLNRCLSVCLYIGVIEETLNISIMMISRLQSLSEMMMMMMMMIAAGSSQQNITSPINDMHGAKLAMPLCK